MKSTVKLFAFIILTFNITFIAQDRISIKGIVTNESDTKLSFVNIFVEGSFEGTMSDEKGHFEFTTINVSDTVIIVATMLGYEKYRLEIINPEANINLDIRMVEEAIELESAIVMGSSYSSEKAKGLVVSQIDVYTTPGGAADVFQSIKALPGITQVSESAELYVRGGDPIETVTIVDQASIYHPFTYESSYGGLFSNLNTAMIKSLYFTSGGFSSKYGNVLSGVLDIETIDGPVSSSYNLGISVAAVSLSGRVPLIEEKLGLNIFANQSFTKPIMWLNGDLDQFTSSPSSRDITVSFVSKYSQTGSLKLVILFADDKQGAKVERAEYIGAFEGNSSNTLFNLQQKGVYGKLFVKNSLSYNRHKNEWNLGILDLDIGDNVLKFRNDSEIRLSKSNKLFMGIEIENREETYNGRIPAEDFDIRPEASHDQLDASINRLRYGLYAELESSNILAIENLSVIGGVRADHFPILNVNWIDPRFAIGYKINEESNIKLGMGIFHQLPDARLFSKSDGNPNLKAMRASHFILSYDHQFNENNNFRIEAYHKKYEDLPLENDFINYNNEGHGFANGIDIILKGRLPLGFSGWISYGFINTKRKWMNYDSFTRSDFDITHQLSLIAKYNLSSLFQLGINYKVASGRPYTPIVGSNYNELWYIYVPVDGKTNSDRYQTYHRLDFRLTHFNQLFGLYNTIVYVEALNILNIKNLFGYTYSEDYSSRSKVKSYFGRRTIVIGTSISF